MTKPWPVGIRCGLDDTANQGTAPGVYFACFYVHQCFLVANNVDIYPVAIKDKATSFAARLVLVLNC